MASVKADSLILITSAWVAPMNGPIIRDGAIVVGAGKIVGVGNQRDLRRDYPEAEIEELPGALLLPGLINAHVHLELSDLSCGPTPSSEKGSPHPNPLPAYRERKPDHARHS